MTLPGDKASCLSVRQNAYRMFPVVGYSFTPISFHKNLSISVAVMVLPSRVDLFTHNFKIFQFHPYSIIVSSSSSSSSSSGSGSGSGGGSSGSSSSSSNNNSSSSLFACGVTIIML